MSHLYKRGAIWWAWYYLGGQQVRFSTRCRDRRAAEAVLRDRERRAAGEAQGPEAAQAGHTVDDALEALLQARKAKRGGVRSKPEESRAGQLSRLLGQHDVEVLTLAQVVGYVEARGKEGKKDITIHKELTLLRLALRLATRRGLMRQSIEALFPDHSPHYQPRERWLTEREFGLLWKELKPHRQLWLLVAVFTGARKSEVNNLRWEDFDWKGGWIRIRGTKTRKSDRTIPLPDALRVALTELKQDQGPVVTPWVSNTTRDLRWAAERATKKERARLAALGLGREAASFTLARVTPNDLRRTLASWMVQRRVPARFIADWLGHTSTAMVDRVYARLAPDQLRQAALQGLPATLPKDCDAGVITPGASVASLASVAQAQKEKNPQENQGVLRRTRRDSNPRPLASEAKRRPR